MSFRSQRESFSPTLFVLDVDGVLTDGKFYYDSTGKALKIFGADDHDALNLLREYLDIEVLTADAKGYEITYNRVSRDMNLPLSLVSSEDRISWIEKKAELSSTIYMGDGIFDFRIFKKVKYSIAPANGFSRTREVASFVTRSKGAEGAVAEACIHIAKEFFGTDLIG
jgi:3-deoxy-D-manno-octulosonate 8-phosphate phosphatase (KDO 8-P phosphatase)